MKKISLQYGALLTVLVLGLLSSCPDMLNRPDPAPAPGEGLVQVSLVTAEEGAVSPTARTAMPRAAELYYNLVFTKGAMTVNKTLDQAASISVGLQEGTWSLGVTGFSDSLRTAPAALTGSATIVVTAGASSSVTVDLTGNTGSGTGSIAYEIKFPDSTDVGTLILNNYSDGSPYGSSINLLGTTGGNSFSTADGVTTATGTIISVSAGYYQALVKLSNTTANRHAGYTALVHVYGNAATGITKVFDAGHFVEKPMVDALDLTGLVVAPVKGATPVATAIDAAQYTGTIAWTESDGSTAVSGNFAAAAVYKAIVTLTVNPDFSFIGVGADAFSYTGATATNAAYTSGDIITVTITFLPVVDPGLRYVKQGGTGNGASWYYASSDLQKMIDQARADMLAHNVQAIVRVAAGTYKPLYAPAPDGSSTDDFATYTTLTARDKTFILRPGVEIRGGYTAAGETIDEPTRKARFNAAGEPKDEAHRAILSGDIDDTTDGGNVRDGFTGMTGNAYHVVLGVDIPDDVTTILDGFTIRGGNADVARSIIVNTGGDNRLITSNRAGGMYNIYSSPALTNLVISGNSAVGINGGGGGMYNTNSSPELTNLVISGNSASSGGGIYNNSSPVLTNVVISGNSSSGSGGGMYNGNNSSPVLTDVVISGNKSSSGSGGGIYNISASPVLTNVTIAGNSASGGEGGGIYNNTSSSSPKIRNSIIWGNSSGIYTNGGAPEVYYSIVQNEASYPSLTPAPATNYNLNIDPVFVSETAASSAPTTGGDYHLQSTSPVINRGDHSLYPDTWTKWQEQIGATVTTKAVYDAYVEPALRIDAGGADRLVPDGSIDPGAYEEPGGIVLSPVTLTIADQGGGAFNLETFTVDKDGNPGAQSKTVSVTGTWDNPPGPRWFVDGALKGTGNSININATNYSKGRHSLSLWVERYGQPWSKTINFTVTD